jgi:hypothetical protein
MRTRSGGVFIRKTCCFLLRIIIWPTVFLNSDKVYSFRNAGTTSARMLIWVTPAGLEQYFLEGGQPAVAGYAGPPPDPDMGKLLALAPKYGLEIQPPGG